MRYRFALISAFTFSCLIFGFTSDIRAASLENEDRDLASILQMTDEQLVKVEKLNNRSIAKLQPIYEQIKQLREEADEIRKENMEQFIAILTKEQQKVFEGLYSNSKSSKDTKLVEKTGKS